MKTFSHLLKILFFLFAANPCLFSRDVKDQEFIYISPVPGSSLVNEETSIILKTGSRIESISNRNNIFKVAGSKSGNHDGELIKADNNTIIFKPYNEFYPGEHVFVTVKGGTLIVNNRENTNYNFDFFVRAKKVAIDNISYMGKEMGQGIENKSSQQTNSLSNIIGTDSLPSNFPQLTVIKNTGTAPGYLFLSNISFSPLIPTTPYIMIIDNSGNPVFYRNIPMSNYDFKLQNNLLTYFSMKSGQYLALDTNYNLVDSFKCGNGYGTDLHELRLLPNGHALLMSYDSETVDMSQVVTDGDPLAVVSGLIIQEIDQNKNVVFQWRSWDHFKITDATHENLLAHDIDPVHGNALEIDRDGNIILSSRHMDEITKIDRQTGQIIWRLGGKNNQFKFLNDPIGFSHQHSVRILDNGHITMFDNGNYHNPPFSRAVEYVIDTHTMSVSPVWQFRHNPDVYGAAMGYVQRLPNGNTLIGWGSTNPSVTEVTPEGSTVYELTLPPNIYSYRTYRFTKWNSDDRNNGSAYDYHLWQNYPNPFNPSTTIRYTLSSAINVKITIYDLLGREVSTIVNEYQQPGEHLYQFNGNNLASGIYFYKLQTGNASVIKKMVLLK